MLERRTFLLASSASAALHFCFGAAGARAAAAQTARKPVKVGILSGGSLSDSTASLLLRSFKDAMRDLGWIEKRNVVYVERYYEADVRKVEFLTAELDAEKVDVIFADFGRAALLAAKVAPRVPIVFGTQADPVGAGIVASLARPGGNITGMLSYAADFADNFRRAAGYVDKILQGAKPADLPVQQPTRFELVINMKTVKALGLKVPPEIMVRVDRVIE